MAGLVESAIRGSIRALLERDESEARRAQEGKSRINQLQIENDAKATTLLALQQPVARDLRFITAGIKINNDLERMGNIASNIARSAMSVARSPTHSPSVDISLLAKMVEEMVSRSLQSFVERDEQQARAVVASDEAVGELKNSIYQELVSEAEAAPGDAAVTIEHILIAHNLERIADHATNIAEDVLFFVKGIDVRHQR